MSKDTSLIRERAKARNLFWRFLRCLVIGVVGWVLLAGGFLYFNLYVLFSGSGPAGPEVPAEAFRQVWSDSNTLLVGIGDSITDGFGAESGFSYFERLIKNPKGDCEDISGKNLSVVFPRLEALNVASSGSTSLDHIKQIRGLKQRPPDVFGLIVITTGGNDLIHDYGRRPPKEGAIYGATLQQAEPWIRNFEKRLNEMTRTVTEKFPGGCEIFLGNVYDPTDGTGDTATRFTCFPAWPDGLSILKAYNTIISRLAEEYKNVHLVDIHGLFLGHGIHCKKFWSKHYCWGEPHYWYNLNIEDPSERGYDAIRRLFLIEMAKVFSRGTPSNNLK
jgi:lysophospholipase L1-like esterase